MKIKYIAAASLLLAVTIGTIGIVRASSNGPWILGDSTWAPATITGEATVTPAPQLTTCSLNTDVVKQALADHGIDYAKLAVTRVTPDEVRLRATGVEVTIMPGRLSQEDVDRMNSEAIMIVPPAFDVSVKVSGTLADVAKISK